MKYDQAMVAIRRKTKPIVGRGNLRIAWRFGHPVLLTHGMKFLDYTPTREDMAADDWAIITGDDGPSS